MSDNDFPRMVFKFPGRAVELQDGSYDTLTVADAAEFEQALADGWHPLPFAARDAHESAGAKPDTAPPTRAELEQKAAELGVEFKGTWGDKKLSDAIAAQLKG